MAGNDLVSNRSLWPPTDVVGRTLLAVAGSATCTCLTGVMQACPGTFPLLLFILWPRTTSHVSLLHILLVCSCAAVPLLSQPVWARKTLQGSVMEHRASPLPCQGPSLLCSLQTAACPLATPSTAGHVGDLHFDQWSLTYCPCPSHVTEAICLSDPWLLQALHGPQLPPQAREGPFGQRAAGA